MTHIVFAAAALPLLDALFQHGYTLSLTHACGALVSALPRRDLVLLVSLDHGAASVRAAQASCHVDTPWLAWNHGDDQTLTLLAYAAGASAGLPRDLTAPVLLQTIATVVGPRRTPERPPSHLGAPQHRYRRGTVIRLDGEMLLDITRGVVAQSRIHTDGSEVLLLPARLRACHPGLRPNPGEQSAQCTGLP
jgi:hypothetical protein